MDDTANDGLPKNCERCSYTWFGASNECPRYHKHTAPRLGLWLLARIAW